jgi:hypothetical protein
MPKMSRRPLFFEAQNLSIVAREPVDFLRLVLIRVNHLLPRAYLIVDLPLSRENASLIRPRAW